MLIVEPVIKELSIEGLKNVLELEGNWDKNCLEQMAQRMLNEDSIDEIEFILALGGE